MVLPKPALNLKPSLLIGTLLIIQQFLTIPNDKPQLTMQKLNLKIRTMYKCPQEKLISILFTLKFITFYKYELTPRISTGQPYSFELHHCRQSSGQDPIDNHWKCAVPFVILGRGFACIFPEGTQKKKNFRYLIELLNNTLRTERLKTMKENLVIGQEKRGSGPECCVVFCWCFNKESLPGDERVEIATSSPLTYYSWLTLMPALRRQRQKMMRWGGDFNP